MPDSDYLYEVIRAMSATGAGGLEGLAAELLAAWTKRRFFLCRSGDQAGKDASTAGEGCSWLAVECKRYGQQTEFDHKSVLGGFVQALRGPSKPDLWILLASKSVPEQLAAELSRTGRDEGVDTLIVDVSLSEPSRLAVLCASHKEVFLAFMRSNVANVDLPRLQRSLDDIRGSSGFSAVREQMESLLADENIGYEGIRAFANKWLVDQLVQERQSKDSFGQFLNVRDPQRPAIRRKGAGRALDRWWGISRQNGIKIAITGAEYSGKTWAVADWLAEQIGTHDDWPLTVIVPSFRSNELLDPVDALAEQLDWISGRNRGLSFWRKRVTGWLSRPSDKPAFLLLIDGLNENHNADWRKVFDSFSTDRFRTRAGVIVTARTEYWRAQTRPQIQFFEEYILPPYDDDELRQALSRDGRQPSEIPASLKETIRNPRYCEIIAAGWDKLAKVGDWSIERLIWEDWKDRINRKHGPILSDEDFEEFLANLAKSSKEQQVKLSKKEVLDRLPLNAENARAIDEILTGGILVREGPPDAPYQLKRELLTYALGMLLAWDLRQDPQQLPEAVDAAVEKWLEPHSELGQKSEICSNAVLHSLTEENYPTELRSGLLRQWLRLRNLTTRSRESAIAFFPACPESYFELAEHFWSFRNSNSSAQGVLADAFIKYVSDPRMRASIVLQCERWMGFVHKSGNRPDKNLDEKSRREAEQRVAEQLQRASSRTENYAGLSLAVVEDEGLLRLTRLALRIISAVPDKLPFTSAFLTWGVSRTVMGWPAEREEVAWTLRFASGGAYLPIEHRLSNWVASEDQILQDAAFQLLTALGTRGALSLRKRLPPRPINAVYQEFIDDPCVGVFSLPREECSKCMIRDDIPIDRLARQMRDCGLDPKISGEARFVRRLAAMSQTVEASGLGKNNRDAADFIQEQIEPVLASFVPSALADLSRRVARSGAQRSIEDLWGLFLWLEDRYFVLGKPEVEVLMEARARLLADSGGWADERGRHAMGREQTAELYLTKEILHALSAEQQIDLLLDRPVMALDLRAYEIWFKPLADGKIRELLGRLEVCAAPTQARILWFLSAQEVSLDQTSRKTLRKLLNDANELVRTLALRLVFATRDLELAEEVQQSSRRFDRTNESLEHGWGARIVCEVSTSATYESIRNKLDLFGLGEFVCKRRFRDDDVRPYAEDLDSTWRRVYGSWENSVDDNLPPVIISQNPKTLGSIGTRLQEETDQTILVDPGQTWQTPPGEPDIKKLEEAIRGPSLEDYSRRQESNFVQIREARRRAPTEWYGTPFRKELLVEVVRERPDLVDRWTVPLTHKTALNRRFLNCNAGFYSALCRALLVTDPARGRQLWGLLRSQGNSATVRDENTEIDSLVLGLFEAPDSQTVEDLRWKLLEASFSDMALLELATSAQLYDRDDWLRRAIEHLATSNLLWKKAESLALVALSDIRTDLWNELCQKVDEPDSWIDDVKSKMEAYHLRNRWARTWYSEWLTRPEIDTAWSAFRLFLKCADKRFWIWKGGIELEAEKLGPLDDTRRRFFDASASEIRKAITENQKDLNDTFLGIKFSKRELLPFS